MANMTYIPLRPGNDPASTAMRRAQQGEVTMAIDDLETEQEAAARDQKRIGEMMDVLRGMYQEIRRGLESAPDLPVTEIAPHQIHSFLTAAHELMRGDPLASPPAPLGNVPISRRATVLQLRSALEGLARRAARLSERQALLADRLAQACTVSAALTLAEQGLGYVLCRDIRRMGVEPHPAWFFDFDCALAQFNFQKLNRTEISLYFSHGL